MNTKTKIIKECFLTDEFEGVTVIYAENGELTFDVSALNGVNVIVITNEDGKVTKQVVVKEQANEPPSTESSAKSSINKKAYNIGDVLPDGWIVGPKVRDRVISIEPLSSALHGHQTWYKGEEHAAELRENGHRNARQPDSGELKAIYKEVVVAGRNSKAQFKTSNSTPHSMYWSTKTSEKRFGEDSWAEYGFFFDESERKRRGYNDLRTTYQPKDRIALAQVRIVRDEPDIELL